ncbi:MAG: hypothetical protein O7D91_05485, partial [Planctomycetota bacterium]|nr:hypothetical protein [Planctomycetota bacterium]
MMQKHVCFDKWKILCQMSLALCCCVVFMGADCEGPPPDPNCVGQSSNTPCPQPAGAPDAGACEIYVCDFQQQCVLATDGSKSGDKCSDETDCVEEGTCQGRDCVAADKGQIPCTKDDNECTDDICDGKGKCTHPNEPNTVPCTDDGEECTTDFCDGAGACGHPNKAAGTDCTDTDNNDCTSGECDGMGECEPRDVPDNTDCENDGNVCTTELCLSGVCTDQGCDPRLGQTCTTSDGKDGTCQTITGTPPCQCVADAEEVAVLYIANIDGFNITSYQDPSTVNGNIPPDTNLEGVQTQLDSPSDIVITGNDTLIVSNFGGNSVTSYANARESNGNLTPDGNVQGAATLLDDPVTLAVNTAEDLLFVANFGLSDEILVYTSASTSSLNGNLAPTRIITSTDIQDPIGINFGANDDLYVANASFNNVVVIAGASEVNGIVTATRIIDSGAFDRIFDVFIDSNDTMYVVDFGGFIYTFNNAST